MYVFFARGVWSTFREYWELSVSFFKLVQTLSSLSVSAFPQQSSLSFQKICDVGMYVYLGFPSMEIRYMDTCASYLFEYQTAAPIGCMYL